MHAFKMLVTGAVLAVALTGCPPKEGPMEKVGKGVDEAKEKVEDVFEKDGPVEKAGEKVDEAAEDLKEAIE